jgi:hypothetical protein
MPRPSPGAAAEVRSPLRWPHQFQSLISPPVLCVIFYFSVDYAISAMLVRSLVLPTKCKSNWSIWYKIPWLIIVLAKQ